MTASRKSIIILFFALCAGYLVGWGIIGLIIAFIDADRNSITDAFIFCFILIDVCCYPPLAFSYLFSRQVGNKFSRFGIYFTLPFSLGIIGFISYGYYVGVFPDPQGFAGLVYLIIAGLVAAVLSCYVIGFACINKKQKRITRVFGGITLINALCIVALLLAGSFQGYIFKSDQLFELLFSRGGMLFWPMLVTAPLALICAVFLGLKEDEQSV